MGSFLLQRPTRPRSGVLLRTSAFNFSTKMAEDRGFAFGANRAGSPAQKRHLPERQLSPSSEDSNLLAIRQRRVSRPIHAEPSQRLLLSSTPQNGSGVAWLKYEDRIRDAAALNDRRGRSLIVRRLPNEPKVGRGSYPSVTSSCWDIGRKRRSSRRLEPRATSQPGRPE